MQEPKTDHVASDLEDPGHPGVPCKRDFLGFRRARLLLAAGGDPACTPPSLGTWGARSLGASSGAG